MKRRVEEQVVQKFDRRCPYCDQPLLANEPQVPMGEHPITCSFCQKTFIHVVSRWPAQEGTK